MMTIDSDRYWYSADGFIFVTMLEVSSSSWIPRPGLGILGD